MERQSHSFIAGLFVIVLGLAAIAGGLWLTPRSGGDQYAIDLLTTHSVSGLQVGAPVRFRGVNVGNVKAIGFDVLKVGRIRVRIMVDRKAPVTTTTIARLGYEGINGVALIQLDDDAQSNGVALRMSKGVVPEIELQPGMVERLEEAGGNVLVQTARLANRLEALLSDTNERKLIALIDSLQRTSERYGALAKDLTPTVRALPGVVKEATLTLDHARGAIDQVGRLAGDTDGRLTELDAVKQAAGHIGQTAEDLHRYTVPRLDFLIGQLSVDAQELDRTVHQINTRPQSFIFGPAVPLPGPGEPGFVASHGGLK